VGLVRLQPCLGFEDDSALKGIHMSSDAVAHSRLIRISSLESSTTFFVGEEHGLPRSSLGFCLLTHETGLPIVRSRNAPSCRAMEKPAGRPFSELVLEQGMPEGKKDCRRERDRLPGKGDIATAGIVEHINDAWSSSKMARSFLPIRPFARFAEAT